MKIKNNILSLFVVGSLFGGVMTSCDLNYDNESAISPDNVWTTETMIDGFLTDIYGRMLPGWPFNGASSDEAIYAPGNMSEYLRGIIDVERTGSTWSYAVIDRINFFLDNLENVPQGVLTETQKDQMRGQALFWRAYDYWGKVSIFGGVPLILHTQNVSDLESLFVPRSKTSECVEQIVKDLDEAISLLPGSWDDSNYGRIDKCAAMAFKGRVLLWYASPLFNPSGDQSRWKAAYEANKAALEFCKSQGKGLYPDFKNIWYDEQNEETIMSTQFYYPDHSYFDGYVRPEPFTRDNANYNQPIMWLLQAFPKKDGSSMKVDVERLSSDKEYNSQYLADFYNNRDDRFYATIFCGGTKYPTDDISENLWNVWRKENGSYWNIASDQITTGSTNWGNTGFYQIKGLDTSLTKGSVYNAETDWIEIRFAEVLMNYGECANEIGESEKALDVLYQIRKRANIEAGNGGNYGITATTQEQIREAYIDERFVEFAFENKRFPDLRRWKRFDILNNEKYRSGLYVVLNDDSSIDDFEWSDSMYDENVRKHFHFEYIKSLDNEDAFQFNLDLNHWFYPISVTTINRNKQIEQNNEWGGTFDPLL